MLNVSRTDDVRLDPRMAITVLPLLDGSKSEQGIGGGFLSAREFIEGGGGGGAVGGTVLVGARVESADCELPAGYVARDLVDKAPSDNMRRELLEKEGKEKGYDMKLWKKVGGGPFDYQSQTINPLAFARNSRGKIWGNSRRKMRTMSP